MANPSSNIPHPSRDTILKLSGGDLVVSLADGREIAAALRRHLETDPRVAQIPMLSPNSLAWLRTGDEAAINSQGILRIGMWLLQARGDEAVLSYRPVSDGSAFGYQYLAPLRRRDSHWEIVEIRWEKVFYRP